MFKTLCNWTWQNDGTSGKKFNVEVKISLDIFSIYLMKTISYRFGFPNPVNYNDNELFCGGYAGKMSLN